MAFRPNWYDNEPRRRSAWSGVRNWSGFRWIFTLNIVAFLLQLVLPELGRAGYAFENWLALRAWWPLDVEALMADPSAGHGAFNWFFPVQLVTYAFLHSTGDVMHILLNMLYLWFFAPALETMKIEALPPGRDLVRVVPALLGPDAGLVGAGFVAFEAL